MPTDDQKRELKEKLAVLIRDQHGGDAQAAFGHYATDGLVDRTSLKNLLRDAGVGSVLTRGAWADGILEAVDADRDRKISWTEFASVYQG